jgi:predicted transcriptional regulator
VKCDIKAILLLTAVSCYDTDTYTFSSWIQIGNVDEKQIVKNIKNLRLIKQVSPGKLSKLTGLTKSYVSKIENSDKAPPFSTLIKIANVLDTEISLLDVFI